MRKEKFFVILVFCSLVAENYGVLAYYEEMWTPGRLLELLMVIWPIKLSIFQLICMYLAYSTASRRRTGVAKPVTTAIRASAAALTFAVLYGAATGGDFKPMYTQAVAWVFCLVFSIAAIGVLRSSEHFYRMNTAIVFAAVWRAAIVVIFYMKVRGRPWNEFPAYMSTHEDTVLFVVGLLILVSRTIEFRSKKYGRLLLFAAPVILAAIQFNNRRLAWASLAFGLMIIYFLLPTNSKVTRKLNRSLLLAAPVIVAYIAVGWGRPEPIFKPVAAISSMGGGKVDPSTKARDNENMGMMTMIRERPLLGTGLGHEWVEIDATYTVPTSVFPMYHYSPHNSVLALAAFLGSIGFAALWMVIPVSVFLNARSYSASKNPVDRHVAVIALVETAAFLNQSYGDMGAMGVTHMGPATFMGLSIAAAARLAASSGAWPSTDRRSLRVRKV
jgi:hypothetical protein